jgi:hypothetical protein
MRRLTESRPVDADRNAFFTDAEIFACIIGLRLVGAAGEAVTHHITTLFTAKSDTCHTGSHQLNLTSMIRGLSPPIGLYPITNPDLILLQS